MLNFYLVCKYIFFFLVNILRGNCCWNLCVNFFFLILVNINCKNIILKVFVDLFIILKNCCLYNVSFFFLKLIGVYN